MLNVEVDVNHKIRDLLKSLKEEGANLTIPFNSIAKSWFRGNRSIFTNTNGPGKYQDLGGHNPSAPVRLRGKTVTRRTAAKFHKLQKFGFVYPIMKATGHLEDSLTNPTHPDAVNLIINKNALYLGTRVKYAPYHQLGGEKLPQRPVVFLGVEQIAPDALRNENTRWINILEDHYAQLIKQKENEAKQ